MKKKVAIILLAEPGTHEALGRAVHALLYASELHEKGAEVKLVFDAGGTKFVEELAKEESVANPLFRSVEKLGIIDGVCDYCAGAFEADKEQIKSRNLKLISQYNGHPSIADYILNDYQVICL